MPSKAVVAVTMAMICISAGRQVPLPDGTFLIDHSEIARLDEDGNGNTFAEPVLKGFRFAREVVNNPQEADGEDRPRRTIDFDLMNIFGGKGGNNDSRNGGGLFQKNDASRNGGSGAGSSNERFPFKSSRSSDSRATNDRSWKDRLTERRSSNSDEPSEFTKLIRKFSNRGDDNNPRTSSTLRSLNMNNRFFSKSRFSFENSTFQKNRSSRERAGDTVFGPLRGLEEILQSILSKLFNKPDSSESDDSRRTDLKSLLRSGTRNNLSPSRGSRNDRLESIVLPEETSRMTKGATESPTDGFLAQLLATLLAPIMGILDTVT